MNKYLYRNGKKLKYGYTTGTCAAAATKAAAQMLLKQRVIKSITIEVPKGWILKIPVKLIELSAEKVICSVKKDAGDDPDITDGIEIIAVVRRNNENIIAGGEGVGVVTKPGLPVVVGEPAINPVPRKMIKSVLSAFAPEYFHVEVRVPEGKKIAKKTFNPNLGIKNGISILGTSGIVEPMSSEALKDSLTVELRQMMTTVRREVIITPGNYGKDYLKTTPINPTYVLKISNYVGFILDQLMEQKVQKVLFVGHVGKLIKVASGNFNTHSKMSDSRIETLTAYAALAGVSNATLESVFSSLTTDAAIAHILKEVVKEDFFYKIVQKIKERMERYTYGSIEIEVIMFSNQHGILGQTLKANQWMKEYFHE